MLDFSKIQKIIEEELGTNEYYTRIIQIATILDKLNMDQETGAEDLLAKEVIDRLSGKVRYIKNMDVMDARYVGHVRSIEEMNERTNINGSPNEVKIETELIKDFIHIGKVNTNRSEKRTLKNKMDQISEIEEEIKVGKKLVGIKVGKQTANDWLSDLAGKLKGGDSKFIKDKIKKIRKKSQENVKKNTATDLIKRVVTKNDMKNMSSKEICDKYEFEYNPTTRKFISRLKLRMQEV